MSGYKYTLPSLIFFLSMAAFGTEVTVAHNGCPIYELQGKKSLKANPKLFPPGSRFNASPYPGHAGYFIVRRGKQTYALNRKCLTVAGERQTPSPAQPAATPVATTDAAVAPQKSATHGAPLALRLQFVTDQGRVSVHDPVSGDSKFTSQTAAFSAGVGYRSPLSGSLGFLGEAGLLAGRADAGTATFTSRNNRFFGLRSLLGLEIATAGEGMRLGLAVPIVYESISWESTTPAATASSTSLRAGGAVITFDASRGGLSFIASFGFLQRIEAPTWSFGVASAL